MKKLSKKSILNFFYAFDTVLAVIFLLALFPLSKKTAPKKNETYLLNPKNISSISKITFKKDGVTLSLSRSAINDDFSGRIWTGTVTADFAGQKYSDDVFPCDSKAVENFLASVSGKTFVSKKTDSISAWKSFGLDESQAFCVCFSGKNGEKLSELYFGMQNSLKKTIFLRANKTTIFEADDNMSAFLTTDESYWVDPFIFPQSLTGYSRSESEQFLRHGRMCSFVQPDKEADFFAVKDFGNGSRASFYFYKGDGGYTVHPVFEAGPAFPPETKKQISSINYNYNISEWTFESLRTLLQER